MNSLASDIPAPSEQFSLALTWDNIFDMEVSMENWFQSHYTDGSIQVYWEEKTHQNHPEQRRAEDEQHPESRKESVHMEYHWFVLYGHTYSLIITTENLDTKETLEKDFGKYKPHIQKRIQDISAADVDGLTGLCSAKIFFQRSKKLDENPNSAYSLIYFDIDNLKGINDKYDHIGGDAYIKAFSEVLQEVFRSHDYVIRKGGDEFVVIMGEWVHTETLLISKIKDVQERFSQKEIIMSNGMKIEKNEETSPSASGGYSIKTKEMNTSFDKVLQKANNMANIAKGNAGKVTRIREMLANADDLGTTIEVTKILNQRIIEILQETLTEKVKKAKRQVERRVNRVLRAIKKRYL